jgi:hypothetical protein
MVLVLLGYRSRQRLDRFRDLRRSVIAELALLAVVVGLVALLTNLPPGKSAGSARAAAAAPRGGVATVPMRGGGTLTVWPGRAGTNAFAVRLPNVRGAATLLLQQQDGTVSGRPLRRNADGTFTLQAQNIPSGALVAQVAAGPQTWAATVEIGPRSATAGVAAQPLAQGPMAAGQAEDLAVGLQRVPAGRARVTVLEQDGAAIRNALVTVQGRVALPCKGPEVCYEVRVGSADRALAVKVERAGRPPATGTIDLPAAGAGPAGAIVKRTVSALAQLKSLVAVQHLASDPAHSVVSHFVVNAPDKLEIHVEGGLDSVLIGDRRWDRAPGEGWKQSKARPVEVPDPFWAQRPIAPYVAARSARTVDVTLAFDDGTPTWFRLHVDRHTGRVLEVHMVTAAHFMVETYSRFDSAPAIRPPVR